MRLTRRCASSRDSFRDDPASADQDSLYFQLSGSSMAAGVVSGMAALMIQADPSLNPDTIKARLMKSAEKRLAYDLFSEGAGFADLHAAMAEKGIFQGLALSPKVEKTDGGLVIDDAAAGWLDSSPFDPRRSTGPTRFAGPEAWAPTPGFGARG